MLHFGTSLITIDTNTRITISTRRACYRDKKVVVVMPAYNAARTLKRTYDEVMDQGVVDLVIVVDDASRDETTASPARCPIRSSMSIR